MFGPVAEMLVVLRLIDKRTYISSRSEIRLHSRKRGTSPLSFRRCGRFEPRLLLVSFLVCSLPSIQPTNALVLLPNSTHDLRIDLDIFVKVILLREVLKILSDLWGIRVERGEVRFRLEGISISMSRPVSRQPT